MTEAQMISSTEEWPRWPILPMVRRESGNFMCGIIHCAELLTVYHFNIFDHHEGKTWGDVLRPCEKKIYQTVDDLLKEWRVD